MVNILTKHWNSCALPDSHPDKAMLQAEERLELAEIIRREIYLENTTDLRVRKHTRGNTSKHEKEASSRRERGNLMLLAVGSPAYVEAYNHQLSFTINGQELDISQGRLHELSKQYAEDLRRQIDNAKTRNLDPADLALMHTELTHVENIVTTTDPQHGKMSDEDHLNVREALNQSEGMKILLTEEASAGMDFENTQTQADITARANRGSVTEEHLALFASLETRSSFASQLEASPLDADVITARQDFNIAAKDSPADLAEPSKPDAPKANAGMTL